MKIIADLHIHSKYSRGCSRDLEIPKIAEWCVRKGIELVTTGDFTHPKWLAEIKDNLMPAENGFYRLKNSDNPTRFVVGGEISCIYKQGDKCRRIHLVLLLPSIEVAERINEELTKRGCNLKSDGRPIIGLSAKELAKICWTINESILVIPAHAWTPWFSIFGSKSGFDLIEECFEELSDRIYAIETGLSSDPPMNWQLSMLDRIVLISNSDAHSLINLGREANILEFNDDNFNYEELLRIIKEKDQKKFLMTLEFFPEEGKYHVDGHADCRFSCEPAESLKNNNRCPKCGKLLTLGVLNRVNILADRKKIESEKFIPYKNLIPLQEIIADYFGVGKTAKKVLNQYFSLTDKHNEFAILLDLSETEIAKMAGQELAQMIVQVRTGQVDILPGYDGVYGRISIKNSLKKPEQKQLP